VAGWFLSVVAATVYGAPPVFVKGVRFSNKAVNDAIRQGIEHLWSTQQDNGSWGALNVWQERYDYKVGPTALVAYALMESGISPQDARLAKAMDYITGLETDLTYDLAFRAMALEAASRWSPKYLKPLRKDVYTLIRSLTSEGGYTYYSRGSTPGERDFPAWVGGRADNSNSQYGLLGVWAGQRAGIDVPREYWSRTLKYWFALQAEDGGWNYNYRKRPHTYPAMTVAGLASVYVCMDNLYQAKFANCADPEELEPVRKGLEYMDRKFIDSFRTETPQYYYYLFGVERVGLAAGYKYFGGTDWYKYGATKLLARRRPDGGWEATGTFSGTSDTATAFALLFLVRGQKPVLFNKLRFQGDWNNRPRDLASLTRWISRIFETTVNWQVIDLSVPVSDWHDAPLIYISGAKAPQFSDEDVEKLRRFVRRGGTLFSCTECKGKRFAEGIRELYGRLFKKYELLEVAQDHPIYSCYFKLKGRPKFFIVSNGVRPLAIHTDADLPRAWQLRTVKRDKWAYEAAANVYALVTDMGALWSRGTSPWPEGGAIAVRTAPVARLRHSGNWDPEPLAFERFSLLLGDETGLAVKAVPTDIEHLPASDAKVAHLTGTGPLKLTDDQRRILREFVEAGGTLIVDAAGGDEDFARSAQDALIRTFQPADLRPLSVSAPVFDIPGLKIESVRYRGRLGGRQRGKGKPDLRAIHIDERPAVFFSREDITCGLVGYPSYLCRGYQPESAYRIMRNIIIQAVGKPAEEAESKPVRPSGVRPVKPTRSRRRLLEDVRKLLEQSPSNR